MHWQDRLVHGNDNNGNAGWNLGGCCLQGAVYVTKNAAYSWTAAVQETVDATLNRTVSSGVHDHNAITRSCGPCNAREMGSAIQADNVVLLQSVADGLFP